MVIFSLIMNIDFGSKIERKLNMKKKIVKYLSTTFLIISCIALATVFYVRASGIWTDGKGNEGSASSEVDTNVSKDEIQSASIENFGTIISEYVSKNSLRCEWAILKNEGENILYIAAELYLDSPDTISKSSGGYLMINGEKKEFDGFSVIGTSNQICTMTQAIEVSGDFNVTIDATLFIDINEESGLKSDKLTLLGTVLASESHKEMPTKHLNSIEHISQYPELPSGDEVTALAMVLSSLGYKVDKCDLCDIYLEKGPVGYTDFKEANVGNPRDAYNSYGCLPPVIISAAERFVNANGGSYCAYDYSKRSAYELYYQVSQGKNVIVWACEDFDITPSISRIWIVDGKEVYQRSNVSTMVLIGYDFENKTVTLSSPSSGEFTIDMELFEYRYFEMGAYSVVIK